MMWKTLVWLLFDLHHGYQIPPAFMAPTPRLLSKVELKICNLCPNFKFVLKIVARTILRGFPGWDNFLENADGGEVESIHGESRRTGNLCFVFFKPLFLDPNFSQLSETWKDRITVSLISLCFILSSVKWV